MDFYKFYFRAYHDKDYTIKIETLPSVAISGLKASTYVDARTKLINSLLESEREREERFTACK